MKKRQIILILLAFLAVNVGTAQAEDIPATISKTQKNFTPPANMSDEALASYISGRLNLLLEDSKISQYCNAADGSVVIQ
ncbi:MAG: hypothetical protein KAS59_02195 [Alphaproteobacteria bacterium]|nr:hypothetical protein [Alphaproteobacteria bacterium]